MNKVSKKIRRRYRYIRGKYLFPTTKKMLLVYCIAKHDNDLRDIKDYLFCHKDLSHFFFVFVIPKKGDFSYLKESGRSTIVKMYSKRFFIYISKTQYWLLSKNFPRWIKPKKEQLQIKVDKSNCSIERYFSKKLLYEYSGSTTLSFYQISKKMNLEEKSSIIKGYFRKRGLFLNEKTRKIYDLKNKYKGERVFLIGNGPSLKGDDLNKIKNEYSFGCNMIHKIFNETNWRPSFLFIGDSLISRQEDLRNDIIKNINGKCVVIDSLYKYYEEDVKDIISVHTTQAHEIYKFQPNMLAYTEPAGTVMCFMIGMAMWMGFKNIYLLGVDFTENGKSSGGHFCTNYTSEKLLQASIDRTMRALEKEKFDADDWAKFQHMRLYDNYDKVKKYAEKAGYNIYNATRGGALEIFPRVDFDELFIDEEGK